MTDPRGPLPARDALRQKLEAWSYRVYCEAAQTDDLKRKRSLRELADEIETQAGEVDALLGGVGPQQDFHHEPWFVNLSGGVRELVQLHANRRNRHHLLASIDEAIRRLGEVASTGRPAPEQIAQLESDKTWLRAQRDVAEEKLHAAETGAQEQMKHLASAMRKVLPPDLLAQVLAHLDPLTPFEAFLRGEVTGAGVVAPQDERIARLEAAIRWALGEDGTFSEEPPPLLVAGRQVRKRYWWRSELRERAFGVTSPEPAAPDAGSKK